MKYRKSPLQIEKYYRIQQLSDPAARVHHPESLPFSKEALARLYERFAGKIVFMGEKGYDEARQEFDPVYQAYPILICYVVSYNDVKTCLEFARAYNIQVALRSGGHSFGGYSVCDGMVVDLGNLNNIYVDTNNNTAFIEAGATFEKIFPVIESAGLHMVGGGCPTVAVAGYMQGGGFGITSRMFGMNCDSVLNCTVMLADGTIVTANANENPDLFWALRGGTGGNFGVLLNVTYQLYKLGNILGVQVKWAIDESAENAAQALYALQQNYLVETPYPNLGIETILTTDTDGIKKLIFCATWIGSQEDFEKALQPLQTIPGVTFGEMKSGKYSDINSYVLEGTPNVPEDIEAFARSAIIDSFLDQDEWKKIIKFFYQTAPNQYTMIDMEFYGGKINSVPVGSNAFIHRKANMDFFCLSFFNKETNDQQQCLEWMEAYYKFMIPYTNGHSYQNYPDRNQTDFRWAYWGQYYDQLVHIKRKYDPSNFFNYQQSIGPDLMQNSPKEQIILFTENKILYENY